VVGSYNPDFNIITIVCRMTQPHVIVDWGLSARNGVDLSPEFRFFLPGCHSPPEVCLLLDSRIYQDHWREFAPATPVDMYWRVSQLLSLQPASGGSLGGEYLVRALVRAGGSSTNNPTCYYGEFKLPIKTNEGGGTFKLTVDGATDLSLVGMQSLIEAGNVEVALKDVKYFSTRQSAEELAQAMRLGPTKAENFKFAYPLSLVDSLPEWPAFQSSQFKSSGMPRVSAPIVELKRSHHGSLSFTLKGLTITDRTLRSLPLIPGLLQRAAVLRIPLPDSLRDFARLSLVDLNLSQTAITPRALSEICHLPDLDRLDVRGTMITPPDLYHLSSLSKLRQVWCLNSQCLENEELKTHLQIPASQPC
jgi:hypothetical protein